MAEYPKLGLYRAHVKKQRQLHKLTNMDFEIVLFAAEHDTIVQSDVYKKLTDSMTTVTNCFYYLVDKGFLRIAFPGRGRHAKKRYTITPKGRRMVADFYASMFPDITRSKFNTLQK